MHTTGDHHGGPRARPSLRRLMAAALVAGLGLGPAVAGSSPAAAVTSAEVTARVSVSDADAQVFGAVQPRTFTDTTGRFVAFTGAAAYVTGDANAAFDVYLRDRLGGTTTQVSVDGDGEPLWGASIACGASSDLRYIAFWSNSSAVSGTGTTQLHLRDRVAGTTEVVSLGPGGVPAATPGSGLSSDDRCDVSLDGRYVVFASPAANLVADGNGVADVFRRDRTAGTTLRVSVGDDESELTGHGSTDPQISDSGDRVVWTTKAQVVAGDANGVSDVFLRTVSTQATVGLSRTSEGAAANGPSSDPAISGNGLVVAFTSSATDLPGTGPDGNGPVLDVYVKPLAHVAMERVSVSSTEVQADHGSSAPSLSADGRHVAFVSNASNLWPLEGNNGYDVFRRDRVAGLTVLSSRRVESAVTSTGTSGGPPSVSADGSAVAFAASAPDLVRGDTNGAVDAFVRDVDVDHSPFDSFDELVAQQFADLAGRAPTPAEALEWRTRLRHGEASPDQVVTALASGPAWSQHRGPVTRLYWAFFLRAPDKAGLDYWVAQKAGGKGLHTIAGQFAGSKEFKDTYGSLGNQAFVTLVYQNVLQRDPAPNEVAYWVGQVSSGAKSRGSVMVGFSESAEGRAFLAPQVGVVLVSVGMLGTIPPKSTFAALTSAVAAGGPLEEAVALFRTSAAYTARAG